MYFFLFTGARKVLEVELWPRFRRSLTVVEDQIASAVSQWTNFATRKVWTVLEGHLERFAWIDIRNGVLPSRKRLAWTGQGIARTRAFPRKHSECHVNLPRANNNVSYIAPRDDLWWARRRFLPCFGEDGWTIMRVTYVHVTAGQMNVSSVDACSTPHAFSNPRSAHKYISSALTFTSCCMYKTAK